MANKSISPWQEITIRDGHSHAAHRSWMHRETFALLLLLWDVERGWWYELRHQGRADMIAAAGKPDDPKPRAWAELFEIAARRLESWADAGEMSQRH